MQRMHQTPPSALTHTKAQTERISSISEALQPKRKVWEARSDQDTQDTPSITAMHPIKKTTTKRYEQRIKRKWLRYGPLKVLQKGYSTESPTISGPREATVNPLGSLKFVSVVPNSRLWVWYQWLCNVLSYQTVFRGDCTNTTTERVLIRGQTRSTGWPVHVTSLLESAKHFSLGRTFSGVTSLWEHPCMTSPMLPHPCVGW